MSNWQQQPPQQWSAAPQGGFVGQPQQGQGWGQGVGQWHQAPPQGQGFFPPQQQQQQQFPIHQGQLPRPRQAFPPNQGGGGFVTGSVGGYVSGFQPGGSGVPPRGIGVVGQQQFSGFPLQQQQMQAMQQQQQVAYVQEQQRLVREEQKKRELEIQKRKLMNINVAHSSASSSLSFDDLVDLKASSSPKASPKVNKQGQSSTVPKATPTVASATTSSQQHKPIPGTADDPLPTHPAGVQTVASDQLVKVIPTTVSRDQGNSAPSASQSGNTFDKLMESSLSNLKDTSPARSRKMDFKSSSGSKASPLLSSAQQKKAFSESTRARAWTADGGEFSGIFAEHASNQQLPLVQAPGASSGGDDSFGEFQSVGVGVEGGVRGGPQMSTDNQTIAVAGFQPTAQPAFQGQVQFGGSHVQPSTRARGGSFPGVVGGGGGNTVATSAYQHPIPSTSVSQKPLSPSHFAGLDPNKFPPLYSKVFERCSKPGEPHMNTELLFPLLVSSQLPKNMLRDLWSLANREVPGKLNQTELFVLLGLIGLAQSGNPSPTPEDLKKAPQLPIPKLTALEEEALPPAIPSQSLSSAQGPTPLSAQPPPSDDFGDFQQGQQSSLPPSFLASMAPPTAPPFLPSTAAPPPANHTNRADDKYSVFDEFKSTGTQPPSDSSSTGILQAPTSIIMSQPQGKPPSGDKYSVFDDLRSTSSDDAISVALSELSAAGGLAPPQGLLLLATAKSAPTAGVQGASGDVSSSLLLHAVTNAPTAAEPKSDDFGSFSSAPLPPSSAKTAASTKRTQDESFLPFSSGPSTSVGSSSSGFADFASFQSHPAPSVGGENVKPSVAKAEDSNQDQGWAAFTDFTSSSSQPPVPPSKQDALFPATLVLGTASKGSSMNKSKADSAFDSLLPAELLPSSVSKSTAPVNSLSLSGSLDSKPSVSGGVGGGERGAKGGGLDLAMFELDKPSPAEGEKKAKDMRKQLTGLEVLEEEFSARVSAKTASSAAAPAGVGGFAEPLMPESAPLDDFGDFAAYSSPSAEEKGRGLLLSGGGDSPPNLKKSSTEPLKVWRTCLSKCSEVLESCASVFAGVKEEAVLEEIAQSEEGRNKLKGIVEVYRLAKRVYRPFREKKEGAEGEGCVLAIQKQWKKMTNVLPNNVMSQLYTDTTPASVEEEDVLSDSISKCSLCLTSKSVSIPLHLSLDGRKEDYTLPLLFYRGQSYHPSCANFWVNVVQEELPVLT